MVEHANLEQTVPGSSPTAGGQEKKVEEKWDVRGPKVWTQVWVLCSSSELAPQPLLGGYLEI